MQNPHNKIERSLLKIVGWTVGILVFLIVAGVFGHRSFRNWQERRLVAQANALVTEGDLKRASLDARRILQVNPESVEGFRIVARIEDRAGAPSLVQTRRRIIELAPGDPADVLALARDAQRFEDAANRDYALKLLPESAKSTAEYHALLADMAGARQDRNEVEQQVREAVQLAPANKDYALRLATLQLASPDRATQEQARQTLVALQTHPGTRREASRRLVEDALRRRDYAQANTFARLLTEMPEAKFADRLLLLSALHGAIDPEWDALLRKLQTDAAEHPDEIAELLTWFNAHALPAAAVSWATQLPAIVLAQKAVPIALSDSYIALGDWAGMQRMLSTGKWGSLEFLRNALSARAYREVGNASESAAQWAEAVRNVSATPPAALTLAEIVQRWGWRKEAVELFWVAAKDPQKGDDALRSLYLHFASTGESQDLYRVLLRRREFHPDDLNIQNNVAQLSLLLNLNASEGQRLATAIYEKEPKNAAYASTYAFALSVQGDTKKALKVFNALTDEQLHQPEIAAYYGIILAGAGEPERAAEFLRLGETARLLPEERSLTERAQRTIAKR